MCKRPGCRATWCLRLEHWIDGFVASRQVCPNKCSYMSAVTKEWEHSHQNDCRLAPGLCCDRCGGYWVPDLPADVAQGMLEERVANAPNVPPGWVEREFKQNAALLDKPIAA